MTIASPDPAPPELTLTVAPEALAHFLPLLGEGILVSGRSGASAAEFLERTLGIPGSYLRERVQTVFLNGKAIDDLDTAAVPEGATLALSAAMPGLAGAVLRRGSFYAGMRRQISLAGGAAAPPASRPTRVTVKLFNLVAAEIGPRLLAAGVEVEAGRLRDFLGRRGRTLKAACRQASIDGRGCAVEAVGALLPTAGAVRLKLLAAGRTG